MQPMKPSEIERILTERQNVTREDIHEYQRLVAQRIFADPRVGETAADADLDRQISVLHEKLYGVA